jgi:hypothetical protein
MRRSENTSRLMREAPRGAPPASRLFVERRVCRVGGSGDTLAALALFEPVTVAVHFQDVHMVCEPVEQRAGQPLGGEHAGPFVERQVTGDNG